MKTFQHVLIIVILLTASFQGISQTYTGDEEEINHILKNAAAFSQYVMNADYDQIMTYYTTDGKIFPNNRPIIEGQKAIRAYWVLPEGVKTVHHKVTASEIKIIGDEAYDYGHYEGRTRYQNGEEGSWKGKYVIVWKKVDGDWKMYLDIWNAIKD